MPLCEEIPLERRHQRRVVQISCCSQLPNSFRFALSCSFTFSTSFYIKITFSSCFRGNYNLCIVQRSSATGMVNANPFMSAKLRTKSGLGVANLNVLARWPRCLTSCPRTRFHRRHQRRLCLQTQQNVFSTRSACEMFTHNYRHVTRIIVRRR